MLVFEKLDDYMKHGKPKKDEDDNKRAKDALAGLRKQLKDAQKSGAFNTKREKDAQINSIQSKIDKWEEKLSRSKTVRESLNELEGGRGDNLSPEDVDPDQLEVGQETEMEHTNDEQIALQIALDHLAEDPEYYTTLVQAGLVDEPEALRKYRELIAGEE